MFRRMALLTLLLLTVLTFGASKNAFSQPYEDEIKRAADTIASAVHAGGGKSVAVLDFADLQGYVTEFGRFIAEELSSDLVGRPDGFSVIDRANLHHILTEQKLTMSGLVNPENAKKLGRFAGVDTLIVGTVTQMGNSARLSIRAIATETARVIGTANTNITLDEALSDLLTREIRGSGEVITGSKPQLPGSGGSGVRFPVVSAATPAQFGQPHFQNQYLRAWATSVGANDSASSMSIGILVENYSNETLRIALKGKNYGGSIRGYGGSFTAGDNSGGGCHGNHGTFSGAAISTYQEDRRGNRIGVFDPSTMTALAPRSTTSFSFSFDYCNPPLKGDIASFAADFMAEIRGKREDFSLGISGMKITRIQAE